MNKQVLMPDPMATPLGDAAPNVAGSNTAPFLPYHDLRQWLDEAQKLGEVKEVGGLSYQRDIGMVVEMSAHAGDDIKRSAVSPKELLEIQAALRVILD